MENPANTENYIPILVHLKDNFNNVYGKRNFDAVLSLVTNRDESKERKILCILDGLDEYRDKASIIEKIIDYKKNI